MIGARRAAPQRVIRVWTVLLAAALLGACSGGGWKNINDTPGPAFSPSFNPTPGQTR